MNINELHKLTLEGDKSAENQLFKKLSESFWWWTDEQKEFNENVHQFAEDHYEEAELWFWKNKFPWPLVKKVADKGYFGAGIPKEYGGLELGATGSCIVSERAAAYPSRGSVLAMYDAHSQRKRPGVDAPLGTTYRCACTAEP